MGIFRSLNEGIRKYLSSFNPFSHSSIIFRKKAFLDSAGYKQNFECTHEYELWVYMFSFGKIWNLNEELNLLRLSCYSL